MLPSCSISTCVGAGILVALGVLASVAVGGVVGVHVAVGVFVDVSVAVAVTVNSGAGARVKGAQEATRIGRVRSTKVRIEGIRLTVTTS